MSVSTEWVLSTLVTSFPCVLQLARALCLDPFAPLAVPDATHSLAWDRFGPLSTKLWRHACASTLVSYVHTYPPTYGCTYVHTYPYTYTYVLSAYIRACIQGHIQLSVCKRMRFDRCLLLCACTGTWLKLRRCFHSSRLDGHCILHHQSPLLIVSCYHFWCSLP